MGMTEKGKCYMNNTLCRCTNNPTQPPQDSLINLCAFTRVSIHKSLAMKCLTIVLRQEWKSLKQCSFLFQHPRSEHPILVLSQFNFKPIPRGCTVWFPWAPLLERANGRQPDTHSHSLLGLSVEWPGRTLNKSLRARWDLPKGKGEVRTGRGCWAGCAEHSHCS